MVAREQGAGDQGRGAGVQRLYLTPRFAEPVALTPRSETRAPSGNSPRLPVVAPSPRHNEHSTQFPTGHSPRRRVAASQARQPCTMNSCAPRPLPGSHCPRCRHPARPRPSRPRHRQYAQDDDTSSQLHLYGNDLSLLVIRITAPRTVHGPAAPGSRGGRRPRAVCLARRFLLRARAVAASVLRMARRKVKSSPDAVRPPATKSLGCRRPPKSSRPGVPRRKSASWRRLRHFPGRRRARGW